MDIYRRLLEHFGHRNWWPGDTPYEIMIGAILTQNTSWKNVEKAINSLKKHDLLEPDKLAQIKQNKLAKLIRSSGYYNQKAIKLINFTQYFNKYGYSIDKMNNKGLSDLRNELLELKGIGPETADSMLLYALGKPVFVVDAYTIRAFSRMGFVGEKARYHDVQDMFMTKLKADAVLFNDYHAQIVALGHNYCRRKPKCDLCPLFKKPCRYSA